MSSNKKYSKQDCIESLQEAAEQLGKSPMLEEYRELDLYPTYKTFYDRFGSWNEAKEAAGLKQYSSGRSIIEKPYILTVSDEEWENFSAGKRHHLRRRVKLDKLQINAGCQYCGYDSNPRALQFHHTDPDSKEFNISQAYPNGYINWEEAKEEIKKCEILCANCHRIQTSKESLGLDI